MAALSQVGAGAGAGAEKSAVSLAWLDLCSAPALALEPHTGRRQDTLSLWMQVAVWGSWASLAPAPLLMAYVEITSKYPVLFMPIAAPLSFVRQRKKLTMPGKGEDTRQNLRSL